MYITDSNWNTAEDILKLERAGKASTFAYYDSIEKYLILNLDSHKYELDTLKNLELFKSAPETEIQTLIHEFGHAVDYLILNDLSHTREFKNLYEREKNNIHIENYMKQDSVEFFASTFSYMFSPNTQYRERIANEAPETVQYIKNKLKVTGLIRENK
ncbi:anthrax toxin lethal factor-related metalloendopeptidase [Bacillus pretiosus]|uniref:anthrax toxin lethal factor-related metalloendopeptidase n=1 Tax=Bacillus pretiosus TaxID=2983392 RepID=UPI003D6537E8